MVVMLFYSRSFLLVVLVMKKYCIRNLAGFMIRIGQNNAFHLSRRIPFVFFVSYSCPPNIRVVKSNKSCVSLFVNVIEF